MELSNNDSIPFIGTLITKNGNKLDTQVYRKPTNTGLLLHFQSHIDLRFKKCLIETMVHRAKELSSMLLKLINNSSRENKENHYRDRGLDM